MPLDLGFWILVSVMTVVLIAVVITFAVVIKNIDNKINNTNVYIEKDNVQDETYILQAGLNQRAEWNKEIGKVSADTIKTTTQTNKRVDTLDGKIKDTAQDVSRKLMRQEQDGVFRDNELMRKMTQQEQADISRNNEMLRKMITQEENIGRAFNELTTGDANFSTLAIGPAKITTQGGDLIIDSGSVRVTGDQMKQEYGVSQETIDMMREFTQGDEFQAPRLSKLVAPYDGIGLAYDYGISSSSGGMKVYAPDSEHNSISVGFTKPDKTFKDMIHINNNDRVGIHGDLSITGKINGPTITEIDRKIAVLDEEIAKYKHFVEQERR